MGIIGTRSKYDFNIGLSSIFVTCGVGIGVRRGFLVFFWGGWVVVVLGFETLGYFFFSGL